MLNTYWQPMSELNRLRNEMERVFGRYSDGLSRSREFPPFNVWEDDETLFVEAELPGIEMDDLEIYVTGGNLLSVSGERKQPEREEGAWHRQERAFGKFRRTFDLPSDVDSESVSATLNNGVLTLTLPKREEVKPRRIKVKAK